jgi:hypothetical protein
MDCSNLTYTETQSCTSSSTTTNTTTPNVTLEWDEDEIINGEEFKIKVITKNLLNKKYALKIWISFENDSGYTKSISDRYDENESKWESGTYWIYSFFSGPGNKTESINLRIRVDYSNFFGDAKILAKIKEDDNSDKFYDFLGSIEILKAIEHTTNNSYTSNAQPSILNANNSTNNITKNEVIILGTPKTSKKEANSIIYKSKVEYIREYAPYAFGLVCIFLIIILAIDKK